MVHVLVNSLTFCSASVLTRKLYHCTGIADRSLGIYVYIYSDKIYVYIYSLGSFGNLASLGSRMNEWKMETSW